MKVNGEEKREEKEKKVAEITLLIADDQTLFRKGLISLLQGKKGIRIVGEARTGLEVLQRTKEFRPDVILMDLKMPACNGPRTTLLLRRRFPNSSVIILCQPDAENGLLEAMQSGAKGYLYKTIEPEKLYKCIRLVHQGEIILPRTMTTRLINTLSPNTDGSDAARSLTQREREILSHLAGGESNKQIGNHLGISEHTVKIHLRHILKKLHLTNRVQAAILTLKEGILPPSMAS
jgi:DNA-binding NarL/FixJ family response regulator